MSFFLSFKKRSPSFSGIAFIISIGIHLILLFAFSLRYAATNYHITSPMINVLLSPAMQEGLIGAKGNEKANSNQKAPFDNERATPLEKTKSPFNISKPKKTETPQTNATNENDSHSIKKSNATPSSSLSITESPRIPTGEDSFGTGSANSGSGTGSGHEGTGKDAFFAPYVHGTLGHNPKPTYPTVSRKMGEEGTVYLSVYILSSGLVQEVKIKKSSGYQRLDQAAIQAVQKWQYVPARKNNIAINTWHTQAIKFSLTD